MKSIIFDFGGVLLDWDPWLLYQRIFTSRAEFETFLKDSPFLKMIERSDGGEKFADLIREFEAHETALSAFVTNGLETLIVKHETVKIVEELKALKIPLYGLTNWSDETFPHVRAAHGFLAHFDDILVSGAERLVKPDPAIFNLALTRWGIAAKNCLFIDDRADNVVAAQKLGIESLLFTDHEELRARLVSYFPELACTLN